MENLSRPSSQIKEVRPTSPKLTEEDKTLDLTLRPKSWEDYIGQEKVKKNLQIIIKAAKKERNL